MAKSAADLQEEIKEDKKEKKKKHDSSSSDSEGEEDVGELMYVPPSNNQVSKSRTSVSAEVFGKYNKQAEFVPTIIAKSQDTKQKIQQRLATSFMFKALA